LTSTQFDDEVVVRSRQGAVLVLTINRPEARNSIIGEVSQALEAGFDEAEADPAIRAVVITGAGTAFSSGADLSGRGGPSSETERGGFAGLVRRRVGVPVIAAVNGPAVGGGFEIVLACDLVVAAESAWFSLPEAGLGMLAGSGGPIRLSRRLPPALANELCLLGTRVDANRAATLGLVNRVVPAADVVATAVALGEQLAAAPLPAQEAFRAVLHASPQLPDEAACFELCDRVLAAFLATNPPKLLPPSQRRSREA
jgi:enoyl-CoA hydratase/carnithine racemase